MSKIFISEEHLTSIGNALRDVNATETRYFPSEMSNAILSLKPKKNYVKMVDGFFSAEIAGVTITKVEQYLQFSGTSKGIWQKIEFESSVIFEANKEYVWYIANMDKEPKKTTATTYLFLASTTGHLQSYQLTGTTGVKTFSFSADTEITGIYMSIPNGTTINEGFRLVIEEKD